MVQTILGLFQSVGPLAGGGGELVVVIMLLLVLRKGVVKCVVRPMVVLPVWRVVLVNCSERVPLSCRRDLPFRKNENCCMWGHQLLHLRVGLRVVFGLRVGLREQKTVQRLKSAKRGFKWTAELQQKL